MSALENAQKRIKALEEAVVDVLIHDGREASGEGEHKALREQADARVRARSILVDDSWKVAP
jgi:hypothetical protein